MRCLSYVWLPHSLIRRLWAGEIFFEIDFIPLLWLLSYGCCSFRLRVWVSPDSRKVVTLACIQLSHDGAGTPLLPPDYINNSGDMSYDGTPRSTRWHEPGRAREEYNQLQKAPLSVNRQRKFVFGALYDRLFPGYFEVDPMTLNYDLVVTLPDQTTTMLQIRMVAPYVGTGSENLLKCVVDLGRTLGGPGNCRGKYVGDLGSMHAIGLKSSTSKCFYITKETTAARVEKASNMMTEWMQDNMRDVLREIRLKDVSMGVECSPALKTAPGSRMMVSVDLANSPHYDTGDTSRSVAIWVEEKPGQSRNWYFVLPNMSHNGSNGVVVKLLHGLVISWDGRQVFHCTSKTNVGDGNRAYGCLWSSTRV